MLTREDNEMLTRVGPGTPMGELMREYWMPFGLSDELPEADCPPVRVMLLCEELVAFRDSNGKVGLLDNNCPHRRASLFFGRNEECGLRCVYHGWKFDVSGDCVDMPSEPAESNFKDKVKIKSYPVEERGGIMWTYMGPRKTTPGLPELPSNMIDDVVVSAYMRPCNWMQALEGDIDTVHTLYLHLGLTQFEDAPEGSWAWWHLQNRAPHYAAIDTDFGTMYGAYRPAMEGMNYWRFANFLMPFYAMTPPGVLGLEHKFRAWVPMDDTHTLAISSNQRSPLFGPNGERPKGQVGVRRHRCLPQRHRLLRPLPLRRRHGQRLWGRPRSPEDEELRRPEEHLPGGTRPSPSAWAPSSTARRSGWAPATR